MKRAHAVLCLALLLATACSEAPSSRGADGGPAGRPGGDRPAIPVVAAEAELRTVRSEVEAIGTARANESVTITAKVTDTVSRVNFDDGQWVQAGDVLLELASREEQALLAEADANRTDARTQLKRLENLLVQHTVPVSQVDEARAQAAAAEARYQSVVARLADRQIRAPFSGRLGFRQVSEGTMITPGTAITTLDDVSTIKLDFSVPETYLRVLHPGLSLAARSVAYPDRVFDAEVSTIDSRVDPVTRAATVRALIDNADSTRSADRSHDFLLRPGMLLTVKLITDERQTLMVPEDALVQRGDQAHVYTVQNGLADLREVRHGTRYQGWVEISSGLVPGEVVITEGVIKVRQGVPVRVVGEHAGRRLPAGGDPGR